jgi:hypothetical protein
VVKKPIQDRRKFCAHETARAASAGSFALTLIAGDGDKFD